MDIRACILVVDDNVTMRESLRDTLAAETQRVLCVENAIQGIAELEKQEFDVVLADLSLPRVSGLELLDRVKKSWPSTEVIVITGQGSIATAVDAIKRGAYHYVTKPFTADEILHLVGQALERRRLDRKSTRLNSSHLVISYAVFCLKKKILLTPYVNEKPLMNTSTRTE